MNINTKGTKRNKLKAINDMNRYNMPTYLLKEFNDRRKREARLKGGK